MNASVSQTVIEITPFIATIVVQILSLGPSSKFARQIDKFEDDGISFEPHTSDLETAAALSFDFQQCMRHYILSLLSVTIVFLAKLSQIDSGEDSILISAIAILIVILALREGTSRYFTTRQPNKYWVSDCWVKKIKGYKFYLHYGDAGVIIANVLPLLAIIVLNHAF
ncbi:hypothetical protein [Halomontanus rarus]|uniref:hypothetical protein n=1 Tax=Halomontanus rarus TaxID=3034020 RepID=UPI001A9886C0